MRPLTLQIPPDTRTAWQAAFERGPTGLERTSISMLWLDTPDQRLADKGLEWQLRRDGRRWTQQLHDHSGRTASPVPHQVPATRATPDPLRHAGTEAGERLLAQLHKAQADGQAAAAWLRFDGQCVARRIRTRGAVLRAVFEHGRLSVGAARETVSEVTLTLLGGSPRGLYALAEQWCRRHGLKIQPRPWTARGQRLMQRDAGWPARKAMRVASAREADLPDVVARSLHECLGQIVDNGSALAQGASSGSTEQVHQLRVGIRRLRTAVRLFEPWLPAEPALPMQALRGLFSQLGHAREGDVLESGVAAALRQAGAPPLLGPDPAAAVDPHALMRAPATQALPLQLLCWRDALLQALAQAEPALPGAVAAKRLKRWQRRLAAAATDFARLDETALHALRKRVKRQRYALEFLAPLLPRPKTERYLRVLAEVQEALGDLNDLFTARAHYQSRVEAEPAAWFALGWLTARIAERQAAAARVVGGIVDARAPSA